MKDSLKNKLSAIKKGLVTAFNKTKNYIVNNRKKIGKLLLMVASLVSLSVAALLILSAFNIVYYEDGLQINMHLFDKFQNSWYGWIIIIAVQVVITTLLCFIPGASMAFIMLLGAIYDSQLSAFMIAFIGVMLSSLLMYITGRFGGYAICTKLLGEEDCEKASKLLNNRGVVFFPLMMLFPIFPDDALVMVAGTLKMSLKWFIPSIVVCRGIGIATIIFGLGNIPFDKFTTPWHWIIFILLCAVFIVTVFWLANKLSLYLEKRGSINETETEEVEVSDTSANVAKIAASESLAESVETAEVESEDVAVN